MGRGQDHVQRGACEGSEMQSKELDMGTEVRQARLPVTASRRMLSSAQATKGEHAINSLAVFMYWAIGLAHAHGLPREGGWQLLAPRLSAQDKDFHQREIILTSSSELGEKWHTHSLTEMEGGNAIPLMTISPFCFFW
jgi:hypothetical protein